MQLPRVRFTVRWAIVAVAVVAVGLGLVVSRRKHPVGGMAVLGLGVVWWSDGSVTKGAIAVPTKYVGFGPFLKVEWSDQSTSWYLGRYARTDSVYRQKQVTRCVEALRDDRSASERSFAATWIGLHADLIEPDVVVPALTAALGDSSREVRHSVVTALAEFSRHSSTVTVALALALRDDDAVIRVTAAYALQYNRTSQDQMTRLTIPALTRVLNDKSNSVRCTAAKSLVSLGASEKAVPAMIEMLQDQTADPDRKRARTFDRRSAIEVLERIGPGARAAVPALVEAMKDNDPQVRVHAAAVLLSLGEPAVALPVLRAVQADGTEDSSLRSIAITALEKFDAESKSEGDPSEPTTP